MSDQAFYSGLQQKLDTLKTEGLFKPERVLASRQGAEVVADHGRTLINMCANNYLGLSGDIETQKAAEAALQKYGYGLSSVRFICGTQTVHKELEKKLSDFLGTEDTILYAAAFDANGGVFEPLFDENDAIISDALNHASIIDGIRLCKAARYRYANNDMADLEKQLQAATEAGKRHKIIVTDGVFSMDGTIAQLDKIVALAEKYGALTMIDESHASGFMGKTGRGTHEHCDRQDRHHHGHPRQGAGRRDGRFYLRPQGSHRDAAPEIASLSVLEHAGADDRGCVAGGAGPHQQVDGAARPAA
jgi:glycine C-acetyltransferase